MKKKVLVGLVLLGVLAFGVAYEQPCMAAGCVHEGTSYDDWMSLDDCVIVEDQGEKISVMFTDIDCGSSRAAKFNVNYNSAVHTTVLSEGASEMFGNMELHVSDIFCFSGGGGKVEVQIGYKEPPPPPPPPPCTLYDANGNHTIETSELQTATADWLAGLLSTSDLQAVISCWLAGSF